MAYCSPSRLMDCAFFGKDHRHTAKMLSRDAGHANARSLNRQDLVDLDILEQTGPLGAHVVEQLNVSTGG